jgi:hypothetical protein
MYVKDTRSASVMTTGALWRPRRAARRLARRLVRRLARQLVVRLVVRLVVQLAVGLAAPKDEGWATPTHKTRTFRAFRRTSWFTPYDAPPGHLLRSVCPRMMYKDPGILCATPTDIFSTDFDPTKSRFAGWGCLASLRSCEHLPARLQPPPGVGGWGTSAGVSPRPLPGAAPWWRRLHGRRVNVVQRAHRQGAGRAPYRPRTHRRRKFPTGHRLSRGASLEDVYYHGSLFEGTGIPTCKFRDSQSMLSTADC